MMEEVNEKEEGRGKEEKFSTPYISKAQCVNDLNHTLFGEHKEVEHFSVQGGKMAKI